MRKALFDNFSRGPLRGRGYGAAPSGGRFAPSIPVSSTPNSHHGKNLVRGITPSFLVTRPMNRENRNPVKQEGRSGKRE